LREERCNSRNLTGWEGRFTPAELPYSQEMSHGALPRLLTSCLSAFQACSIRQHYAEHYAHQKYSDGEREHKDTDESNDSLKSIRSSPLIRMSCLFSKLTLGEQPQALLAEPPPGRRAGFDLK